MTYSYDEAREQRRAHHHDFNEAHADHQDTRRSKGGGRRRGYGSRAPGFGPPPGFGPGPKRGPRGGRERGDVRTAVLVLLAEQPRHGYDLMRAIEERTQGAWSPSPGSIYPTLQSLEDEGLITFDTVDGRKTATLTEAGDAWVVEHATEAEAVFNRDGATKTELIALRSEVHGLHDAVMAVGRTRDAAVATRATEILATARKDLYRLLAE